MPDPFRVLPTRHLGHGFPIAEALGCSVSPVVLELFTSVATGYVLLHAVHRGLSAGGGPYLVTTFFDTLIFDGLASAIVPSFITFHVRSIVAVWLKQKFFRSPCSLAPSPNPSFVPFLVSSEHQTLSKQHSLAPEQTSKGAPEVRIEDSSRRSSQSGRRSNFGVEDSPRRSSQSEHDPRVSVEDSPWRSNQSVHGPRVSLEDSPWRSSQSARRSNFGVEDFTRHSISAMPSAFWGTIQSFAANLFFASESASKESVASNDNQSLPQSKQSLESPGIRSREKMDTQNFGQSASPEPYPLMVSLFTKLIRERSCPVADPLSPKNSRSEPESNPASGENLANNARVDHFLLIASALSSQFPRDDNNGVPVSEAWGNLVSYSTRDTTSETNFPSRQTSDSEYRDFYSQSEEPTCVPYGYVSPGDRHRRVYFGPSPDGTESGTPTTETHITSDHLPPATNHFSFYRESESGVQTIYESPAPSEWPEEEEGVCPPCYRFCPIAAAPLDSPPLSHCLYSTPPPPLSSPPSPFNNNKEDDCTTSSSSSSPSLLPFPPPRTTKAICEDTKLPVAVQTWGPVVAGMVTLAYTWQHIDRMVDELMNQTIRTVY